MMFNVYAAVVSDDKDISLLHPAGRQIPIASIVHIGLFDLFPVHIKLPIPEFDFLPFQGHNSLQEHDPGPGESDGHHLVPVWIGKEVSAFPAEMKISVPICRFHTAALNPERKTYIAEKKVGGKGYESYPDEKSGRKFREEKAADDPTGDDHFWGSSPRGSFAFISEKTGSGANPCSTLSPPPLGFLLPQKL